MHHDHHLDAKSLTASPPMESATTTGTDYEEHLLHSSDPVVRRRGYLARAVSSNGDGERDPLLLKSKIQSEETLTHLRRRNTGKRHIGHFYTQQNEQIESLLKSLDKHVEDAQTEEDTNRLSIKIAIYGSLIANCVLAVLQVYAAVSSLSLSFFGTMIDSVFDPAANLMLNYCHRKAEKVDLRKFPSGGSRFETIGEIVYSVMMAAVSLVLVAFSIQDLASKNEDREFHIPAVVAVGIAFLTKLCLFLYCYSLRSKSGQVRVLWEDHRNDLFINGLGIVTSSVGAKLAAWVDPAGALLISAILIYSWSSTCYRLFTYLAGIAAPIEFQRLVIYKAMHFANDIEKIDSCVVYHSGPNYIVEVDIVMAGDTPLWKAHDL
ncbi:hypothetical protein OIO90_002517 [Microbotryomycetes sp. JL221]|nr:hypothetical protein OIO90_002517 [Microbotryomycetes sp. JL221]